MSWSTGFPKEESPGIFSRRENEGQATLDIHPILKVLALQHLIDTCRVIVKAVLWN
jgi:hypothetical protein